jgi:hypothetical protein
VYLNPYQSPAANEIVEILAGRCFKGLAVGGWRDEFSFFVAESPELDKQVTRFYLAQGARMVKDSAPLEFSRGSRLGSAVGLVHERLLRQKIRVSFTESGSLKKVTIHYRVFVSLAIRTLPFQLKQEAESLASQLQAVAAPST